MAVGFEFELEGVEEVRRRLKTIPRVTADKAAKQAASAAQRVVRDRARLNAPNDPQTPESIAKNIVTKQDTKYFRKTGDVLVKVGVLGGAKQYASDTGSRQGRRNIAAGKAGKSYATGGNKGNPGGDTFYWRFLELGTRSIPARPFLRPAQTSTTEQQLTAFSKKFIQTVDKLAAKGFR